MGTSVMILGVSGTGKTASLRNFNSDDILLVNVASKPLPFRKKFQDILNSDNYKEVINAIKSTTKKSIVIDDCQYLISHEFMRRVNDKTFDKFSEMAYNFWTLINAIHELEQDKIVYLIGHIERDNDGNEKFKTQGKLIDQAINVEGQCTIVLKTHVADGEYSFLTQNSGKDTCKSPMGLFDTFAISNDLQAVDEKIRNYYQFDRCKSDTEIKEIDKVISKSDVTKETIRSRRARSV